MLHSVRDAEIEDKKLNNLLQYTFMYNTISIMENQRHFPRDGASTWNRIQRKHSGMKDKGTAYAEEGEQAGS
jgi:hypothetical protein